MADRLTLAEALRSDRLPEFVAQQEAAGLAVADRQRFERIVRTAIKPATMLRAAQNPSPYTSDNPGYGLPTLASLGIEPTFFRMIDAAITDPSDKYVI